MRKEDQALITLETGDIMKRKNSIRVALVLMAGVVGAVGAAMPQGSSDFVRITPAEIHWQNVPDGHGVQQAILFGDPAKPGMYVVRVKFPPHIMDRPHWHPMARYVTVLEGTWYTGTGETFDLAHTVALKPGSFMVHPAKAVHWDGSGSAETVIVQIIGVGPGTTTALDTTKPFWMEIPH
jgi:quercetin dioxygenase-like cupin family protein